MLYRVLLITYMLWSLWQPSSNKILSVFNNI